MSGATPRLRVSASPHLAGPVDTPRVMATVLASLVPAIAAATWFFGPSALLVIAAATAGAVSVEGWFKGRGSLADGSAALTGVLLGLCLPAGMPCWMAFVGGAFGIGAGKLLFGGLGQNVFNPALLGRAFVQAAFPQAITTWPRTGLAWTDLRGDNLALPFTSAQVPDGITAATPLGLMKFDRAAPLPGLGDMLLGRTGGSLGETSDLLLLLGGAYLVLRGFMNWRPPVAAYLAVAVFAGILHGIDPAKYASAPQVLLSGGLTLGVVYMATDPVTSPITPKGSWIFGAGIGVLVVLIRVWGGLPEGVMYAILLMNALTPLLNRATQPRVLGARAAPAAEPAAPAAGAKP